MGPGALSAARLKYRDNPCQRLPKVILRLRFITSLALNDYETTYINTNCFLGKSAFSNQDIKRQLKPR
jgi:hypothetical protein